MPFEIHAHAQHGLLSSLTTVILALLVFVYSRGWFRLRSASPISFPPWRLAAFVGGLFALWIALGSPLAALDHQLLTIHMMKHLLLMVAGAPLILLGAPACPWCTGSRNGSGVLVYFSATGRDDCSDIFSVTLPSSCSRARPQ